MYFSSFFIFIYGKMINFARGIELNDIHTMEEGKYINLHEDGGRAQFEQGLTITRTGI